MVHHSLFFGLICSKSSNPIIHLVMTPSTIDIIIPNVGASAIWSPTLLSYVNVFCQTMMLSFGFQCHNPLTTFHHRPPIIANFCLSYAILESSFLYKYPFRFKLIWRLRFVICVFLFFFSFFVQPVIVDKSTVNSAPVHCSQISQITLFNHFFIKNWSHNTIYIFKNYFATVFSVSVKINSIQIDPNVNPQVITVASGRTRKIFWGPS